LARISRETACFACHTDYTLYGSWRGKLRGLRYLWESYSGSVPPTIKLAGEFDNRQCLQCHEGARSFVAAKAHQSDAQRLSMIMSNRLSCLGAGCHPRAHDMAALGHATFWGIKP
jgi:cytochrome c-type protein NapC